MSSLDYLRLQARRRPRRIAPAGWLTIGLMAAACLGLFAMDRAATIVCTAMGPRCLLEKPEPPML